jgi:hypothetical protein
LERGAALATLAVFGPHRAPSAKPPTRLAPLNALTHPTPPHPTPPYPTPAGEDAAQHGPDGRVALLFLAFLCRRLLEAFAEERAAMVVQRIWRRRALQRPGELGRWAA